MSPIVRPLDYSWQRSPEDYGFDADAKPGDVINTRGDLLGHPSDRRVMSGMVFVTAEQAERAKQFGWAAHPTSAPERNEGLVTICR